MKNYIKSSRGKARIYYGYEVENFGYDDRDDETLDLAEGYLEQAGCTFDYDSYGRLVVTKRGAEVLDNSDLNFIGVRNIYPNPLYGDAYAHLI